MRLGSLVLMCLIGATPALADEAARTGAAAFGDWRTDSPGARRLIRPAELPAPYATSSTANMSQREARTAAETPKAPPGFVVDLFASGLNMPRVIRTAPNGDIFVAETGAGRVRVFHPTKAGGAPAQGEVFAEGLQRPYGIAFYPSGQNPQFVYVATPDSVVRFPYDFVEEPPVVAAALWICSAVSAADSCLFALCGEDRRREGDKLRQFSQILGGGG